MNSKSKDKEADQAAKQKAEINPNVQNPANCSPLKAPQSY